MRKKMELDEKNYSLFLCAKTSTGKIINDNYISASKLCESDIGHCIQKMGGSSRVSSAVFFSSVVAFIFGPEQREIVFYYNSVDSFLCPAANIRSELRCVREGRKKERKKKGFLLLGRAFLPRILMIRSWLEECNCTSALKKSSNYLKAPFSLRTTDSTRSDEQRRTL